MEEEKRVGRPRLYESLEIVKVTLTTEERKRLDRICREENISRHEFISRALKEYRKR